MAALKFVGRLEPLVVSIPLFPVEIFRHMFALERERPLAGRGSVDMGAKALLVARVGVIWWQAAHELAALAIDW
jgi:hypothetical protein